MSKTKMYNNREHNSSSSCTSSSLSSDEEIDARDLKPIKEYLSNRKELARQLFKSVKPEKIQRMLPQVLKQMDLTELEQWCVSELSGMSKTRILSILNDKAMLESSDTSESEDSGPSLEIISDTEEWLTDDDMSKNEEDGKKKLKKGKTKIKGKTQTVKINSLEKSNIKRKCNNKINDSENNDKNKDVKIKKEDDKDKNKEKEKEGDSLLDLLELEMRARAIRALIRKEEDIIPSTNPSEINNGQTVENKMLQDDAKAKEDCRKQLERIINAKQCNIGEDEDVVLVVQPTPVVELLSSDSDGEGHGETRINKKLENERVTETDKSTNSKERKETQEITGTCSNTSIAIKTDLNIRSETKTIMPERNVDIRNNTLSISISADHVAEKRKKSKKRSHSKSQYMSCNEDSPKLKQINITETTEQSSDTKDKNINEESSSTSDEKKVIAKTENSINEGIAKENRIEKERSADLDEVIDLDDYCDVMDIENCDEDKSQDKVIVPPEQNKQPASQVTNTATSNSQISDTSETWASRYYQTDDVQNVIKESKIQSEIRKRLRERQRLSKLSKSPNLSFQSATNPATSIIPNKTPTGSVEEYFALKRAMCMDINTSNTAVQDNPASVNSTNDGNATENVMQDENISLPECADSVSDVTEINSVPSSLPVATIIDETAEVNDKQSDIQPV